MYQEKVEKKSCIVIGIIIFLIIVFIILGLYYLHVGRFLDSNAKEIDMAAIFGQFGDYIGGILNPILGFCTFIGLLYTINLQIESIKLQREELQATREELKRSAEAQEQSAKIFQQQQFETTFFSMLNQLNQLQSYLTEARGEHSNFDKWVLGQTPRTIYGSDIDRESLVEYMASIKNRTNKLLLVQGNIDKSFPDFNQFSLFLYQILKLIKVSSEKGLIIDEKKYSNIVRACIHLKILQLLAISIYREREGQNVIYEKYQKLVEEFNFFEHMPFKIINSYKYSEYLLYCYNRYSKSAFGESIYVKELNELLTKQA